MFGARRLATRFGCGLYRRLPTLRKRFGLKLTTSTSLSRFTSPFASKLATTRSFAAGPEEMQKRITSVEGILSVCNSMKNIAVGKVNAVTEQLDRVRDFYKPLDEVKAIEREESELEEYMEKEASLPDGMRARVRDEPNHLIAAFCSQKGLCGATNSRTIRAAQALIQDFWSAKTPFKFIGFGEKSTGLAQTVGPNTYGIFGNLYKNPTVTFRQCLTIAEMLTNLDYEWDILHSFIMIPVSRARSNATHVKTFSLSHIPTARWISADVVGEDAGEVVEDYRMYTLATELYYFFGCLEASEIYAKLTAMEGATKAAEEMIELMTAEMNSIRQSQINAALLDLTSAAMALDD